MRFLILDRRRSLRVYVAVTDGLRPQSALRAQSTENGVGSASTSFAGAGGVRRFAATDRAAGQRHRLRPDAALVPACPASLDSILGDPNTAGQPR